MTTLLENLLMSEITFGFELEGYVSNEYIPLKDKTKKWDNDLNLLSTNQLYVYIDKPKLLKQLQSYFSKYFGTDITVSVDSSVDNYAGGFEMQSPVFNLTPLNIQECVKFLYNLPKSPYKIFTDDKCGFHTHISFPSITPEDVYWLECKLALDDKMQENLSYLLNTDGTKINFINKKYSNNEYLINLKKYIIENNFLEIASLLSDTKMRLIRNHPQGTLEWRGPRNFLNKNDLSLIIEFFKKLYSFAMWISKTLKSNEIMGYNKKEFLDLINHYHPQYSKVFKKDSKINSLALKVLNKPLSLLHMELTLTDTMDILGVIQEKLSPKKFKSFLINFATKKLPNNILACILFLYPKFYRYSIQHQELPYAELNEISGGFIIPKIIKENKKLLSISDIQKIILDSNLLYYETLNIIMLTSIALRKNILNKSFMNKIANKWDISLETVERDSISYQPIF